LYQDDGSRYPIKRPMNTNECEQCHKLPHEHSKSSNEQSREETRRSEDHNLKVLPSETNVSNISKLMFIVHC
jgi:hypothetical protein